MAFRSLGPLRSAILVTGMGLVVVGMTLLPQLTPRARAEGPTKVAIVVGPAGPDITPIYLELAELAASAAEKRGTTVARAYSPAATPERVVEAVAGANVIVYFGHGTGFPNPYSDTPNVAIVNGWGLQGPSADGSHADSLADGRMRYYGEAWLEASLRPAPGFVMIYSNACYAPGASEGGLPRPTEDEALAHVTNYARPMLALGASAYFATDFYGGAARIVADLLDAPTRPYGEVFRADPLFDDESLTRLPHPALDGAEVWLHHSPYFEGAEDYWYAFTGNPSASFADPAAGTTAAPYVTSDADASTALMASGMASSYPSQPGYGGLPTAALPQALGGVALTQTGFVAVCGDRCVVVPVVDSCPCYWGTADERVINLSHAAWKAVTDAPLAEGLIPVRVYRDGVIPAGEATRQLYPIAAAADAADR